MIEVIPSILADTWDEFVAMARKIEPIAERAHFDILDGGFVAKRTIFGFQELQMFETKLLFDIHLMVMHPEEYVPQWLNEPRAKRIMLHAESDGRLKDCLLEIRSQGRLAGIVLNPETPTGAITEYLPLVDCVQFMTVHPGRNGSPFLTDVIDHISTFHDSYPEIPIAVDGGMNQETVHMAVGAGASIIVSGSYIMNSQDPAKAIAELKDGFN